MNEFGRLLEKEIPRLRRYAFALTRNMSRADDLVQDTLVRAIAKQTSWQCGTNLRAWLFTIMHNQNVNDVRRRVREGAAVEVDNEWLFPIAPTDPTAALSLRDLDRALAQISEEQRQVILLIGLEGARMERPHQFSTCRSGRSVRAFHAVASCCAHGWIGEGERRRRAVRLSRARCWSADVSSRRSSELSFLISCRRSRVDHHRHRGGCSQGYLMERLGLPAVIAGVDRTSTPRPDLASPVWFGARSPRSVLPRRG